MTVYLKLRKKLIDMCGERGRDDAVVIFRGEERGRPEIVVRARKPSDPSLITGMEHMFISSLKRTMLMRVAYIS